MPTTPALSVPTPDPTPQQYNDPFQQPASQDRGINEGEGTDRSLLGASNFVTAGNFSVDLDLIQDLAKNALGGGKHKPQSHSPLPGIAGSLLGGGPGGAHGSHSHSGGSGSIGGIAGQLVSSILGGGGKPQQQHQPSDQHASGGHGGGLMGFPGGHHGSSVRLANLHPISAS